MNTPDFLFFATAPPCGPVSAEALDSAGAFLAFKYFPTPPVTPPDSVTPVPRLLYHDPILS